jgi:phosphatidylglycerol:prolipoprotein diacylglycerol transferase
MERALAALFQIDVWSVAVPAAVLSGYAFAHWRARAAGIATNEFDNASVWAIAVGIAISHMAAVVFYRPEELAREGWIALIRFWEGLSSYGGFAGAALTLAVFYRLRRRSWWREADCMIQGLVVGWIFGRLGCALVGDHPGPLTDWAIGFPYPEGRRHNLGLYELGFTALVLVPLNLRLRHRVVPPGSFIAMNCIVYGVFRFALDFLRATDVASADPRYGSLTLAQYASLATLAFGLLVWFAKVMPAQTAPVAGSDRFQ